MRLGVSEKRNNYIWGVCAFGSFWMFFISCFYWSGFEGAVGIVGLLFCVALIGANLYYTFLFIRENVLHQKIGFFYILILIQMIPVGVLSLFFLDDAFNAVLLKDFQFFGLFVFLIFALLIIHYIMAVAYFGVSVVYYFKKEYFLKSAFSLVLAVGTSAVLYYYISVAALEASR